MWGNYDEEAELAAQVPQEEETGALKADYQDVIISDVRVGPAGLNFSVQILNTEGSSPENPYLISVLADVTAGIASLEKLMREFSLHHKTAAPTAGFTPKSGELVSAKFSDGQWYRAKVRRASPIKKEAEVTFIDYGNQDTVAFKNIRPLDPKFRSLPGQAQDARLRFVQTFSMRYNTDSKTHFR